MATFLKERTGGILPKTLISMWLILMCAKLESHHAMENVPVIIQARYTTYLK